MLTAIARTAPRGSSTTPPLHGRVRTVALRPRPPAPRRAALPHGGWAPRGASGRDVVVHPEQVPGVVPALDLLQAAIGLLAVDLPGEVREGAGILAGPEVHVLAPLAEPRHRRLGPLRELGEGGVLAGLAPVPVDGHPEPRRAVGERRGPCGHTGEGAAQVVDVHRGAAA